jgi:hypothetical protein
MFEGFNRLKQRRATMIAKESFQDKMETGLKIWSNRIEQLKAQAITAQTKAKAGSQEQFNELATRQSEVAQKLQVLKQASDDQWEDLRSSIEKALIALEESFDRAKEKVAQVGWLGWAQGLTEKRQFDSEGWAEGMGHKTGHSEGWVEGMGYQSEDSLGWAEGMKSRSLPKDQAKQVKEEMKKTQHLAASSNTIAPLIIMLNSNDDSTRTHAREALVKIGTVAVPALIQILTDPQARLRWEAAKALSQIGDPTAAAALVKALDDDNPGVCWLAAEGLITLGREGLVPLLEAVKQSSGSVRLREGAHHVLRSLVREDLYASIVTPVLAALEDIEPAIQLPLVAHAALRMLAPDPGWLLNPLRQPDPYVK